MSGIDGLSNWTGDRCLSYFGIHRERLAGLNLPSGTCYGFDITSGIGKHLFEEMRTAEKAGIFTNQMVHDKNGEVVGSHRHDEGVLACALINKGLPVFTHDPLFQSRSAECVFRSGKDSHD